MIIRFVKTQPVECLLDAVVIGVTVFQVKLVLQSAITGEDFGITVRVLHLDLKLTQFVAQVNKFFEGNQAAAP